MISDRQLIKLLDKYKLKTHISHTLIKHVEHSEQEFISGFNSGGRPEGIWYGYGASWLRFLVENEGKLHDQYKPCCYIYSINTNHKNILKLNSIHKLKKFDKKYPDYWLDIREYTRGSSYLKHAPFQPKSRAMGIKRNVDTLIKNKLIFTSTNSLKETFPDEPNYTSKKFLEYIKYKRWDIISKDYDGAEFIPYFKSYRKSHFWYWTIDEPSGCIWDPDAIIDIKLIATKHDGNWEITPDGYDILKLTKTHR